ncbi:hypothetical protein HPG69_008346 [Diceros bicornis minor]|uniref:Doublecortin domain-containing protein n=1 Tax=Diceros bicornis minor TaxID=77932 RepID=A0A7J7ENU9_DICBM|nr:hypothetical protein HPG69_008346 [Diceros bicornis minor]
MGTRGFPALVDTTPAKTILVYRNGDPFYVGRRVVLPRRRVATFEALLEQLTEQVQVPFGVRRLYTPTRGHPVRELDALQAGGKYVAAGRERFQKLDYIHIVPRKPAKMRKLKEIKPVVHCDINVPSRWQTYHRTSRHINVFTNGRLFIPPVKIIIPKFSLTEWNSVLATIGEKVFPLGGVRKKHTDIEKHSRRKKKEDSKGREPHKRDNIPPKDQDSVFYAKERKKKTLVEPLSQSGAEGDVYKAQTPNTETQGAPEVIEDQDVQVEVPVDQKPAEIVKEVEEIDDNTSDFESNKICYFSSKKEKSTLFNAYMIFGEVGDCTTLEQSYTWAPDRHPGNSKEASGLHKYKMMVRTASWYKESETEPASQRPGSGPESAVVGLCQLRPVAGAQALLASLKNLSKNKKVVPFPEEKNTPVLLETPVKIEDQRGPPMGQQPQEESSPRQPEERPKAQELLKQSSLRQQSDEQIPEKQESFEQSSLGQPSQEQILDKQEPPEQPSLGKLSQTDD